MVVSLTAAQLGHAAGHNVRLTWSYVPGPLTVDTGGRYLKSLGSPFLLVGSSPQGLMVSLSPTDQTTYLSTHASQGLNFAQVHVIAGGTFGGGVYNETYDNVHPFNTDGDISTPNNTYFTRLDNLITTAGTYGIVLMLNVGETIDNESLWSTEGNTKCYNFGAYLGNRYKDYPNIIWCQGNDFQDYASNAAARNALLNIIDGIKSADSNHLHTAWLDYFVSSMRDSSDFNGKCEIDNVYSYYCSYIKAATEYGLGTTKPFFLIETHYQDYTTLGLTGTPYIIRKQNYWAMLSGACGITVNDENWALGAGWDTDLTNACYTEAGILKDLFTAYAWQDLVPDSGNAVLTAGYGTKRAGTTLPDAADPYAMCAWITDGSLVIIYMPDAKTMTVDMSKFAGSVTARWFDPTDGSYATDAASPLSNSGTHDFSRAGANSAGDHDWILVLSS